MSAPALPEFEPINCGVIVDLAVRPLEPQFPEDALSYATARVVLLDEEGAPLRDRVYGTVKWTLVQYGAALNAGWPWEKVVDLHVDIEVLHYALFDEATGLTRDEFDLAGGQSDLLILERISVTEGQDYWVVASALLEHVLMLCTNGCFGVALMDGGDTDPELRELLVERGFQRHQRVGWAFFLYDVGRLPPGGREPDPSAH